MSKLKLFNLLTVCFMVFTGCNPSIRYALVRYHATLKQPGIQEGLKEKPVQQSIDKKQKVSIAAGDSMVLYDDKDIKIIMQNLEPDEIDDMAEELGLYSNQRYYRLPGLSFLKFAIEKKSGSPIKFNYFESYFEDEFKEKYAPITQKAYRKLYTSNSYQRFDYDFIYSFYVIEKEGRKADGDEFFFSKTLPGREVQIDYRMKGFQILPFRQLSVGSRKYMLYLQISSEKKIAIPFYYRPMRSDLKE